MIKLKLNRFISTLVALQLFLSASLSYALDVELKQNLYLRTHSTGSVEVQKVGKLTKGSVITLPDSFAVRDSSGHINLEKTLDCWENPTSSSTCPRPSVYKNYQAEQPATLKYGAKKEAAYFPVSLRDIKAAPGSELPSRNAPVLLALEFAEQRGNAIVLTEDQDAVRRVPASGRTSEAGADCASCRSEGPLARTADQAEVLAGVADRAAPRTPARRTAPPVAGSCAPNFNNGDTLYLGDSISTSWLPYSKEVARSIMSGGGSPVARFTVGGSSALSWLNGRFPRGKVAFCDSNGDLDSGPMTSSAGVPKFSQLVNGKRPGAVVIALGTNDLNNYCGTVEAAGGRASAGRAYLNGAAELAREAQVAGGDCVWVLPLTYTSGQIFNHCKAVPGGMAGAIAQLKAKVSPFCKVVDSSKACPARLEFDGPGIHPIRGSGALGTCVGRAVKAELAR